MRSFLSQSCPLRFTLLQPRSGSRTPHPARSALLGHPRELLPNSVCQSNQRRGKAPASHLHHRPCSHPRLPARPPAPLTCQEEEEDGGKQNPPGGAPLGWAAPPCLLHAGCTLGAASWRGGPGPGEGRDRPRTAPEPPAAPEGRPALCSPRLSVLPGPSVSPGPSLLPGPLFPFPAFVPPPLSHGAVWKAVPVLCARLGHAVLERIPTVVKVEIVFKVGLGLCSEPWSVCK